jgi:hypothetical protein
MFTQFRQYPTPSTRQRVFLNRSRDKGGLAEYGALFRGLGLAGFDFQRELLLWHVLSKEGQ